MSLLYFQQRDLSPDDICTILEAAMQALLR